MPREVDRALPGARAPNACDLGLSSGDKAPRKSHLGTNELIKDPQRCHKPDACSQRSADGGLQLDTPLRIVAAAALAGSRVCHLWQGRPQTGPETLAGLAAGLEWC